MPAKRGRPAKRTTNSVIDSGNYNTGENGATHDTTTGPTTEPGTGIDTSGFDQFEPAYTGDTGDTGTVPGTGPDLTRTKRGRPAGTGLGKKKTLLQDIDSVQALLLSLHAMGAAVLQCPELEIEKDEATKIAESIERVRAFYPTNFNPKLMAWFHLSTTLGGVYGLRFMAIRNRLKREAIKKPRIVEMPQRPSPQPEPAPVPSAPVGITVPSQFHPAAPVEDYGY